jgi:probable HAF family extracellular repeat protein
MHRFLLSTVLSLSVLLSTLVAAQDVSYTFTTIDVPGATLTEAYGINAAGQIVGRFSDATGERHGFLKDGATFTTIDVPGALYTEAHGINAAGQIVGGFLDAGFTFHGFLTDGATFITIAVPGATFTEAHGINTAG